MLQFLTKCLIKLTTDHIYNWVIGTHYAKARQALIPKSHVQVMEMKKKILQWFI